jgi:hypothetical protein
MTRKKPTMAEKLDAALLALMEAKGLDYDREAVKGLPAGAVASWFEVDHYPIPVANGGSNHPTNLVPRLKAEHREKTARKDIPMIAKGKRISKDHEAFRQRMLAKLQTDVDAITPSGGNPKKAKIRSGGFSKTHRRKLDGSVVRREG